MGRRLGILPAWRSACIAAVWLTAGANATAAETLFDSGGTGASANLLVDSARAEHHGRYSDAIRLDTRAIAESPSFGRAYLARAGHNMDAGLYDAALADLDRVAAMHPNDFTIPMQRAAIAEYRGDAAGAAAQLKLATSMPDHNYWRNPHEAGTYQEGGGDRYYATGHAISYILALSSIAELMLHQDDAALSDLGEMVKRDQVNPEYMYSYYCWHAAVSGQLELAEVGCQQAIAASSHDIGQYDSLGFTHLRMKAWAKAISDYNTALDKRSDLTTSLYGRGIAKRASGDIAGGNADIAAATRDEPDIANIMKRLGAPAP